MIPASPAVVATSTRAGARVDVYGPHSDLSGVDTTAAVASRRLPRMVQPWLLAGWMMGSHVSAELGAGALHSALHEQAVLEELAPIAAIAQRGWEYGRLPFGTKVADDLGNESALTNDALLAAGHPHRQAGVTVSVATGKPRLTLEEWPDG